MRERTRLWGYEVSNAILIAILSWNLSHLIHRYNLLIKARTGDVLSNNPDFINKVTSDNIPVWAWLINLGGLLITLFFVVGWLIPKLKNHKWFGRGNLIWLLLWLLYFVILAVVVVVAISQLITP